MGDGKSSSVPRVTAKRNIRFHTRASTRSFTVERAPIILEFTSTMIRVGYSENFKPQHIFPLDDNNNNNNNNTDSSSSSLSMTTTNNLSESQWYFRLSSSIQKVYDRLMCNPVTRRVIIVHQNHYIPSACQAALTQLLWNKGVPALTYMSAIEIIPVAQGWKRGLIVQVNDKEAVCVCHADGHVLPVSYQSVPCGYKTLLEDASKLQVTWTERMDKLLLDENNPHSLVTALLKCLELCPRDIRMYVISNIVFCGEGTLLFPELPSKVGKRLQQVLEGKQEPLELIQQEQQDGNNVLTVVPIQTKALQPLANHLAVSSCAPHRPDWIAWVAASLWAAAWNRYDDEESRIQWMTAPSD